MFDEARAHRPVLRAREEVWQVLPGGTPGPHRLGGLDVEHSPDLRAGLRRVTLDGVRLSTLVATPHRARYVAAAEPPRTVLTLLHTGRSVTTSGAEIGAGALVAATAGPLFAYRATEPVRSITVALSDSVTPPHLGAFERAVVVARDERSPLLAALVDLLEPLTAGPLHVDGAATALGSGLAHLVLAALTEMAPTPRGAAAVRFSAHEYIEQHLSDQSLDPSAVAAAVGVSPRSLHAVFQESGTSVARSIRERRLDLAAGVLRDPAWIGGTAEIAARVGFGGPDQFARAFRARFGRAPSAYRAGESESA